MSIAKKSILIILIILIADQILKVWVKTNMTLGENISVIGDWFNLKFIENPGMAFGLDIPGRFGKLSLSIFRLIAIIAIGFFLRSLILNKANTGLVICISLILAGAIGNFVDCAFYGLIFSESNYFEPAQFFPEGGGYNSFLLGKVVDMFYFPVIDGTYPHWIPFVGGNEFIFFRPIFNIADSSISVGVLAIILFQKRFFKDEKAVLLDSHKEENIEIPPAEVISDSNPAESN